MRERFGYKNRMEIPRVVKVVLNAGISSAHKERTMIEQVKETLRLVTGQQSVERKAKKSISSFKVRKGQTVGAMVTLRGPRMYQFLERLLSFTFPRVRDFRGLDLRLIDRRGNLNIGFRESAAFPESDAGDPARQHGLEVTIVTTAGDQEKGLALLNLMGFPFKKV